MVNDQYLLPTDLAQLLGATDRQVNAWTRRGIIPHITLPSGDVLYIRSDIDAWLLSLRQPRREEAPPFTKPEV
jgi:predicted site-specific integrase-resolvase